MSVHVSSWVWKHSTTKGNDRLVLLALADIADDAGVCWPSVSHIASKTLLHEQTVRTRLKALKAAGELAWEDRPGTSNRFRVVMATPTKSATPSDFLGGRKALTDPSEKDYPTPTNGSVDTPTNSFRRGTVIDTPLTHQDTSDEVEDEFELDIPSGSKTPITLPKPWVLTAEMKQWAATQTPLVDVVEATREFVEYWREGEGKGKRKKNWVLTWRNWMKRRNGDAASKTSAGGTSAWDGYKEADG